MSKKEEELFGLKYFQAAVGLSFPHVIHRDKPDFVVIHRGIETGIELTSGSSEEFRRAVVLSRIHRLQGIDTSNLGGGESATRRSNVELLAELRGGGFVQAEQSALVWAERIRDRIRAKSDLMQRGEIERFSRNWQVILNEQSEDIGLSSDFYRAVLLGALGSDRLPRKSFDVIYVLSARHIFLIDPDQIRCEPLDAELVANRLS